MARPRNALRAATSAALAIIVLGATAACAPGGGGAPTTDGESDGPVTLTWWDYYAPGTSEDALVAQLDEYQDENPDVTIERRFIAYDDLKQSLLQSAGASSLPDIVVINGPDHQQFAELGIAADLTERLEEWGELDRYAPGAVATSTLDDRNYGLPITANCLALFYDTELLDAAGLQPPTTWEEMKEVSAALTTDGRYGLAYSAINNQQAVFQWLPTLWQAGGDLTELDSPEAVEALSYWSSLMSDGSVSNEALSWDQAQVASEFAEGRAAMMVNGPWQVPFLAGAAPDLDYGVALLPAGEEEASAIGGENFMVIAGDHEDASWELLQWMQDPARVAALAEGTGSLPTRSDAAPDDESEVAAVFTEQLEVARPRAYGANYAEIADIVTVAIQSVLSGAATSEDALADAASAVQPLLP